MNFLFWEKGGEDAVAENGAGGGVVKTRYRA